MNKGYTVAVVGDSFVRRLRDYLHENDIAHLALDDVRVEFFGRGGSQVPHINIRQIRALGPDVVVVHVGSNNLCSLSAPEVFTRLRNLVKDLQDAWPAGTICICTVIKRRGVGTRRASSGYNERVDVLNGLLTHHFRNSQVRVWKHPENLHRHLCEDGIHMDDEVRPPHVTSGQCRFYRSIRTAVLDRLHTIQ